jgi:subtilisin family serine protease
MHHTSASPRQRGLNLTILLVLIAASIMGLPVSPAAAAHPQATASAPTTPSAPIDLATYQAARWIVQLDGDPVAVQQAHLSGNTGKRLSMANTSAAAYTSQLKSQQQAFQATMSKVAPNAKVERDYQVVVNGLAVKMSSAEADAVRQLPGVKAVTPDVPVQLDTYASEIQIGAPTLWAQLGGQSEAGAGVKVAVIDSGIYVTSTAAGYTGNPCFNDTGYPDYPAGFPKGDTRYTNKKVIVAKSYFRPDDPPVPTDNLPVPGYYMNGSTRAASSSHGTHVAGTIACDILTQTISGASITWSGIAPKAWLMNYRIFYHSVSPEDFQNENGYVAEIVQAIEDAVVDGADIMSNSWGASYQNTRAWPDPMVQAAESAVDAGVVMVFAASNAGPDKDTVSAPGISPKVITVAAVTKDRVIEPGYIAVTGPTPVPGTLSSLGAAPASNFGKVITTTFASAPIVAAQTVATDTTSFGCNLTGGVNPFPDGSLSGKIVVLERSATPATCGYDEKVYNAQKAGAVAAIVYNTAAAGDAFVNMTHGSNSYWSSINIPAWFVTRSSGLALVNWAAAHPASATASFTYAPGLYSVAGDVMASFSSRGPTQDKLLKPDVAAPGSSIYSSGLCSGWPNSVLGFCSASGTSMATPHIAGSAALIKALHPTWSPAQIKSALMSSSTEKVWLNSLQTTPATPLDRGAGRVDLTKAADVQLAFDPASISGGDMQAGQSKDFTLSAGNLSGAAASWAVTTTGQTGVFTVTTGPTLQVAANGTTQLGVKIEFSPDAAPGDYFGAVYLTKSGSPDLHIPVWARVIDRTPIADVLLVDDDGSGMNAAGTVTSTLANYSTYYTGTLNALGVSYTYLDLNGRTGSNVRNTLPTLAALYGYKTVMIFSGDQTRFSSSGSNPGSGLKLADQDKLMEWMDSGGRLWTSGQHYASVSDSNTSYGSPTIGRSRLYHGYLGLSWVSANAYPSTLPVPAAIGIGPMAGLQIDLQSGKDGAGNQTGLEISRPMTDTDTYAGGNLDTLFFTKPGGPATGEPAGSGLSFGRSAEPTLEEERLAVLYRSVSMGFGQEGIDNTTGYASAQQIGRQTLKWLEDNVTMNTSADSAVVNAPVTLHATANSSAGASITQYRWDFGDGSPYVTTIGPSVSHVYESAGPVEYRVEATDSLGHKAVVHSSAGFAVVKANAQVDVVSSANPSLWHQSVTFTAAVKSAALGLTKAPELATPKGTVTFSLDGNPLTGTLSNCAGVALNAQGEAVCSLANLASGTHTISAAYSGDGNFDATSSLDLQQVVEEPQQLYLPLVLQK